ncbi:hypothetical protein [Specibacter cremeus]|uniref:hypothetical protein n=1 Tax=Specibacter cremeus TaxID=1629051 RepID=UPI000F77889E|nr:hypothetical protein [Specibacter cremeus]
MGIRSNRSKEHDAFFPSLTVRQAERLRRLSVEALARHGIRTQAFGDVLKDGHGLEFGLDNVHRRLAAVPERRWHTVIRDHFAQMVAALQEASPSELAVAELLARCKVKLCPPDLMADSPQEHFTYRRSVADLDLAIVVDSSTSVAYLRDSDVARVDRDVLWATARANLLESGPGRPEQVVLGGGSYFALESDSVFQGSWLAYPNELAGRLGFVPGPFGALLSAPASTALNIHLIGDGTTQADGAAMLAASLRQYAREPRPLSPHLYWWDRTDIIAITAFDDAHRPSINVPPELGEVFSREARG